MEDAYFWGWVGGRAGPDSLDVLGFKASFDVWSPSFHLLAMGCNLFLFLAYLLYIKNKPRVAAEIDLGLGTAAFSNVQFYRSKLFWMV